MALQRIPWAVNGPDVAHSATLARQANFAALGGQTGIVGPDSLKVTAGEVPGPHVQVGPGSGTITYAQGRRNAQDRAYAQAKDQLVPVRNDAMEAVEVQPTTSAGGRVDLVVVEINDPEFEGTSGTVDYSTHDFVRFRVIRGVGARVSHPHQLTTAGVRPVLPLARIHIPPSTATITEDMIVDVRHMAVSRYQTLPLVMEIPGNEMRIPYTQESWQTVATFSDIAVPEWATRAHISMDLGPMFNRGGKANGAFRVLATGQNRSIPTMSTNFVQDGGVWERFSVGTAGTQGVSWVTTGSTARLELQISRWGGADRPGEVVLGGGEIHGSYAKGFVTYEEHPIFDQDYGI